MDVYVVIIRNSERLYASSNDHLLGVFSSYISALNAVKDKFKNEIEAGDELQEISINEENESYLYIEKGLHIKIIKCHLNEQRGGKKSKNRSSKKRNNKQKKYSRKY